MAEESIRVTVDKFSFLFPKELSYSDAGVWVAVEGRRARLGLSDFAQQRNGDIAFAKVKAVGTQLKPGDEFAEIETVKVNESLPSPVQGIIVEVNAALEEAPELINQAPYGKGWLTIVELSDWESDHQHLLDAEAYAALVKDQAETEIK